MVFGGERIKRNYIFVIKPAVWRNESSQLYNKLTVSLLLYMTKCRRTIYCSILVFQCIYISIMYVYYYHHMGVCVQVTAITIMVLLRSLYIVQQSFRKQSYKIIRTVVVVREKRVYRLKTQTQSRAEETYGHRIYHLLGYRLGTAPSSSCANYVIRLAFKSQIRCNHVMAYCVYDEGTDTTLVDRIQTFARLCACSFNV